MENLEAAFEAEGSIAANDDTPVFDIANRYLQVAFEVDTAIPSAKALARREFADLWHPRRPSPYAATGRPAGRTNGAAQVCSRE
ncbi:hypothetical protein [Mesorhizobium abyssinicae]|uniref:hypothetical protein n=1 Tax=Mesorhizobium abyssinicae TaxID=1209958 RepID=UPI0033960654